MRETTEPSRRDPQPDALDHQSIAESEIAEIRHEARSWLLANNVSDQRAVAVFALVIAVLALVLQSWWALVLAACVALVVPFRWIAAPHFRDGELRRGIFWANVGSWYLLFPLVLIVPETLPIAMQNVIGPAILAATYLERRVVNRMVPGTMLVAVAITAISFTSDGVGLDELGPAWVFPVVILGYVGANMWLVMGDIQELNLVHLRSLQRAVRTNRDLQEADRALRDSRRRLLVAADEERVRLERNLHDGAQQRLVSLSMQLRLAADLAAEGSPPSSEALAAMHLAAQEAIEEMRELAQGLYPARLHELGLARAIRALARRSPAQIDVVDTTEGSIEAGAEVALYFLCVEAIQNATKHGGPGTVVTVTLADEAGELVVTVADDGAGFEPDRHHGSRGLLNMSDRVGALGGELSIRSEPDSGTVVRACVPNALVVAA